MNQTAANVLRSSEKRAPWQGGRAGAVVLFKLCALVVAYHWSLRLGLDFRYAGSRTGIIWPSNAILLSSLLLVPRRHWPIVIGVLVAVYFEAMWNIVPAWRSAWQIIANIGFATLTMYALRRFAGKSLLFDTGRQVFVFVVLSFITPLMLSAVSAAFVLTVLGRESLQDPLSALVQLMLANTTAMLLVVPVILVWAHAGFSWLTRAPGRRIAESGVMLMWLLLVGLVSFGGHAEVSEISWLLPWTFPPLLWAALRFGPAGASMSTFCIAAISVWGSARQLGPFVPTTNANEVLSLQLFWIGLCPPVMFLAAVTREREKAQLDLLEQRRQLTRASRVAMASELSGALAHELSQPLASSLSNAQSAALLLRRNPPSIEEARAVLTNVVEQNRQAATVLSRLRAFLQSDDSHFEPVAMDNVLRDAMTLSSSWASVAGVEIHMEIAPGLPPVSGDSVQLLQVLLNLIVNGCEAMAAVPPADRHLRITMSVIDGNRMQIVVHDRGVGLPQGHQEFVFKPFFTTKADGLGLGLPIAKTIVSAHGGQLEAENNETGGASFRMILPTFDGPDEPDIASGRFKLSRSG